MKTNLYLALGFISLLSFRGSSTASTTTCTGSGSSNDGYSYQDISFVVRFTEGYGEFDFFADGTKENMQNDVNHFYKLQFLGTGTHAPSGRVRNASMQNLNLPDQSTLSVEVDLSYPHTSSNQLVFIKNNGRKLEVVLNCQTELSSECRTETKCKHVGGNPKSGGFSRCRTERICEPGKFD